MAAIQKFQGKKGTTYRVLIRVKPYAPISKSFKRLTDAKRWAEKTELQLREGKYQTLNESRKHTVADAIERYKKQILPRIQRSKRGQVLEWWKKELGSKLLGNITPVLIAEVRDHLLTEQNEKGKHRSPATVVKYLATLSHVFTICMKEWQWLEENPILKVTKPSLPRGRIRFLSDEERFQLLEACKESSNKSLYPIVVLALSCGMRKSEILNLRWKNIDLKRQQITLEETKNNDVRSVPLAGHALELIQDLDKKRRIDTDLLFPSPDGSKPIDFRSAWRVAVKKAALNDFKFHDCRHSCASYLVMAGYSLHEVGEILGHRSTEMSKRYSHLSNEHKLRVLTDMNSKIFGG